MAPKARHSAETVDHANPGRRCDGRRLYTASSQPAVCCSLITGRVQAAHCTSAGFKLDVGAKTVQVQKRGNSPGTWKVRSSEDLVEPASSRRDSRRNLLAKSISVCLCSQAPAPHVGDRATSRTSHLPAMAQTVRRCRQAFDSEGEKWYTSVVEGFLIRHMTPCADVHDRRRRQVSSERFRLAGHTGSIQKVP